MSVELLQAILQIANLLDERTQGLAQQGRQRDGGGGLAVGRLQARLKVLAHPALLVVDEIGYLPISRTCAMLFFSG